MKTVALEIFVTSNDQRSSQQLQRILELLYTANTNQLQISPMATDSIDQATEHRMVRSISLLLSLLLGELGAVLNVALHLHPSCLVVPGTGYTIVGDSGFSMQNTPAFPQPLVRQPKPFLSSSCGFSSNVPCLDYAILT